MRYLILSLTLLMIAGLLPVQAADNIASAERTALPMPAYQRMAEVSKPDGMPGPPEPLPSSSRPRR